MNKFTFFPIAFLLLLGAVSIKNYDHSYHTGGVVLMKIEEGQTIHHTKCQLDYTITNDSLIDGRFQILDLPTNWNMAPEYTFHGIISHVNSPISFGKAITNVPRAGDSTRAEIFEWETRCSFDNHPGTIEISKTKGKDHFIGKLIGGTQLAFHLE